MAIPKSENYGIDKTDLRILEILIEDAKKPFTEVAKKAFVSQGTVHVRMNKMQEAGIVEKTTLKINYAKLGFDITMYFPEIGAAFLSVDGYHHHLGLNTWQSKGGSPHRQGEAGLEELKIVLPSADDLAAVSKRFPEFSPLGRRLTVKDPDGIAIALES